MGCEEEFYDEGATCWEPNPGSPVDQRSHRSSPLGRTALIYLLVLTTSGPEAESQELACWERGVAVIAECLCAADKVCKVYVGQGGRLGGGSGPFRSLDRPHIVPAQ